MMLSYPVERKFLFLSKFAALFIIIFAVYAGVFTLQIYLLALNPFEPLFYVSLLLLAFQLLLVSALTTTISLITKNEMMSILVSLILFFGLENIAASTSIFSFSGRFTVSFAFFSQLFHGVLPTETGLTTVPTFGDIGVSILVSVGISIFLLVLSYRYYSDKMEID